MYGDEREAEQHHENSDLEAELLQLPLERVGEHQHVEQLPRVVVIETRLNTYCMHWRIVGQMAISGPPAT